MEWSFFNCREVFFLSLPQLIHSPANGYLDHFHLWLLWIMMLQTFMYISFGGRTYSFLLGIYSGVKFLGHKVGNCQTVFKSDSIILHPTRSMWGFQLFTLGICLLKFSRSGGCVVFFSSPPFIWTLLKLRCFLELLSKEIYQAEEWLVTDQRLCLNLFKFKLRFHRRNLLIDC